MKFEFSGLESSSYSVVILDYFANSLHLKHTRSQKNRLNALMGTTPLMLSLSIFLIHSPLFSFPSHSLFPLPKVQLWFWSAFGSPSGSEHLVRINWLHKQLELCQMWKK